MKIVYCFYSFLKNINVNFEEINNFLSFRIYLFLALILNSFSWFLVYLIKSHINHNLVILHYNIDFGFDLIGEVNQLYFFPILSLILILVNLFLVLFFSFLGTRIFLFHLFGMISSVVNFFFLFYLVLIYLINFS